MSLSKKFDQLMSHLNGEDNEMADEFRKELVELCATAQDDGNWRAAFEAAGVDNWSGCDYAYEIMEGDDE